MSDNKQLFMFDLSTQDLSTKISNYPVHFFANTISGVILAANDLQAEYFGNSSVSDFLGKCYFDLISKAEAETLVDNNIITMNSAAPQLFREIGLGNECLTGKTRLFNIRNHAIGVGGIAFYLHQIPLKDIVILMKQLVCLNIITDVVKSDYVSNISRLKQLSDRERECVHHLIRGMTYKEIANVLEISPRTVEGHIENIKNKLGCYSRSDIFSAIFESKTLN